MSLEPQGELTTFRADNIDYWTGNSNNGYQGDLEMALITDSFRKDILGEAEDSTGVLVELKDVPAVHFALLYQYEGDQKAARRVMFNCTASRPSEAGQTTEDTIEPQTETITITAHSIYNSSYGKEIVKAKTTAETDTTAYEGWFEAVHQPVAESE